MSDQNHQNDNKPAYEVGTFKARVRDYYMIQFTKKDGTKQAPKIAIDVEFIAGPNTGKQLSANVGGDSSKAKDFATKTLKVCGWDGKTKLSAPEMRKKIIGTEVLAEVAMEMREQKDSAGNTVFENGEPKMKPVFFVKFINGLNDSPGLQKFRLDPSKDKDALDEFSLFLSMGGGDGGAMGNGGGQPRPNGGGYGQNGGGQQHGANDDMETGSADGDDSIPF